MGYAKEKYGLMIKEISEHKDFGKRNPVDIGVDCGYSEEAVLNMLKEFAYVQKISCDKPKRQKREEYYFLFTRGEKFYIVSVNISNWSTKVIKEVKNYNYIGTLFQIRENIFAKVPFEAFQKQMIIEWENLETNQSGKFFTNDDIKKILLVENGIIAVTNDQIILFKYDGSKIEKTCSLYTDILVEEDGKIYSINKSFGDYYVFNQELKIMQHKKFDIPYEYSASGGSITDYMNGKLSLYMCKEEVGYYWVKYTEDKPHSEPGRGNLTLFGKMACEIKNDICVVRTKNYKLVQQKIYTLDEKYEICDFDRKLGEKSGAGQVIGLYEEDIFIGIGKSRSLKNGTSTGKLLSKDKLGISGMDQEYGDAIIKIDLKKERKTVGLPVYIND